MAFFTRDHENQFPRQYDTDGSGEIEFPEFCNMMSQKMSQQDDAEMVKLVIYDDGENDNLMMAFWAFLTPPQKKEKKEKKVPFRAIGEEK